MDRKVLSSNSDFVLGLNSTQFLALSQSLDNIDIPNNTNVDLLVVEKTLSNHLSINVGSNSNSLVAILIKEFEELSIDVIVKENSHLEIYFADFTKGKVNLKFNAKLLERNATCNWHLSSLTAEKDKKQFDISVDHVSPQTFARMDNYGVCKDDGKLVFSGISFIKNGSKGSKTHQNSKIMVFDSLSNGIAKPILKIDENDIEASHAAVVGKINDEHLFYLTSRGLSESAAKELITFGYLKPIMNGFSDEAMKEEITKLIEGRM